MLVRCLYASRASSPITQALLDAICETSRRNNPPQGITGLLCVSEDVFIQVLEGGRDEVCALYNTIVGDKRHEGVRLLSYEEICEITDLSLVNVKSKLHRARLAFKTKFQPYLSWVRPELGPTEGSKP